MSLLIKLKSKLPFWPSSRPFYGWLNNVANNVDLARIEEVGPDRAAAEWLLRCGAQVRYENSSTFVSDYNSLTGSGTEKQITEINGTDSTIFSVGFPHLKGLKKLSKVVIKRNPYLNDEALPMLEFVNESLRELQLLTIANVSDSGVKSLTILDKLNKLVLFNLPSVKSRSDCLAFLKEKMPNCQVDWPETKAGQKDDKK